MKPFLLLIAFLGFFGTVKADQLAYLEKADADRAAEYLRTQKFLYLYCGCCDVNDMPVKIKSVSVEVRYTEYEQFYEIIVRYKDAFGVMQEQALDLAYTWVKVKKAMVTAGTVMHLEHDVCHPYPVTP